MALHLMKLCVGVETVEQLEQSQARRLRRGQSLFHDTRMMPKRADEITDGGSLYWVIKGRFQVRQAIVDITRETDKEGRGYARLHLGPDLHRVVPRGHRPFQGWRYMDAAKAPQDLDTAAVGSEDLPPEMQAELRALGIL
ncbi:DUF1489 domain-containing protein [Pelagibius litoralis]|uniref:DUF1489 domain-containing protein n=2 Tax=Pelagibius litoralis TaxID=374515 RepID=A0A967F2L6_9PROT|nr:DUF1489 domain-containing protein [Pelagibius litoralis]